MMSLMKSGIRAQKLDETLNHPVNSHLALLHYLLPVPCYAHKVVARHVHTPNTHNTFADHLPTERKSSRRSY
jgi:hypothetical protein